MTVSERSYYTLGVRQGFRDGIRGGMAAGAGALIAAELVLALLFHWLC